MREKQLLRVVIFTSAGSRFVDPLLRSGHEVVGIVEPHVPIPRQGKLKRLFWRLYEQFHHGRRLQDPRQLAEIHNIPYLSLKKTDSEFFVEWLKTKRPDILAVYMGPILKEAVLRIPRHGAINIHPSLLPRYRGGHPILWMHYLMDLEGGVTVHFLDKGIDTGDIINQQRFPIEPGMTEYEVEKIAVERYGIPMMLCALDAIASGNCPRIPQPSKSPTPMARRVTGENYWKMIDWENWTLERTWHFLRCAPLWQHQLPSRRYFERSCRYQVGHYERTPHMASAGSLQRDRQGLFFAHRDGKIYITTRFSVKAFIKIIFRLDK